MTHHVLDFAAAVTSCGLAAGAVVSAVGWGRVTCPACRGGKP